MDISKLTHGAKVVLGATIAFLVVSIFNWQAIDLGVASAGVSMWHGIGVIAGLIAIVIIVWEGLRLANMKIEIGLTPAMVTAALAILLLVFTVIKFLADGEFRTIWAWLGLLLAIVVGVGAWMNMKALGESISDMGSSMKAAAGSATAAAQSSTSSHDHPAAAAPQASSAPADESAGDEPPATSSV